MKIEIRPVGAVEWVLAAGAAMWAIGMARWLVGDVARERAAEAYEGPRSGLASLRGGS